MVIRHKITTRNIILFRKRRQYLFMGIFEDFHHKYSSGLPSREYVE